MLHSTLTSVLLLAGSAAAVNVARQSNGTGYAVKDPILTTQWTYEVGTNPWPQYPRPQLQRSQWQTLNGVWTYENASSLDDVNNPPFNQTLSNPVLIPSCLESALSGVHGNTTLYSWFSTKFSVPSEWTGDRVLLNFGAVDYEATVFVNGQNASFHRGGYFSFTVDVTSYLGSGDNELLVFVHDPTDSDPYVIPIGKQTLFPAHIFYTPCSGIWQQVWIESAPSDYISELQISAGADGTVNITATSSGNGSTPVQVDVIDRSTNKTVATHNGASNTACTFSVDSPNLWSPSSPTLYSLNITLGNDVVSSYTGFRTISRGMVDGIERPLLNGKFEFIFGTLDQGFWPDGIYVPPTYDAMVYDMQTLKKLGFNALRKHIKVENHLYYQAADELGIMIIQDMPALRPLQTMTLPNCTVVTILPDADQQAEFQRQLELLVVQQRNFPSIIAWIIYNEGWGQITTPYYPEFGLTDIVRTLDPTRLVDATTGWYDHGAGDFSDNHHYANPQCGSPFYSIQSSPYDPTRIGIQGEFGGIGENLTIDHLWTVPTAFNSINQTYEIDTDNNAWNYRGHSLLGELQAQIERYACSGGVWTQTTDVEGEVNGLLSYDRKVLRPDVAQWQADIAALYSAAAARSNGSVTTPQML